MTSSGSTSIPESIGPYRLFKELGAGGQARVFRAQRGQAPPVALKLIGSEGKVHPLFRRRFRREVDAVTALRHPHIVPVLDCDLDARQPWFTMPLASETLDERIGRTGPLPLDEAVAVVRAIAGALHALHGLGHVHRDVKPSNILILKDGKPVLADFGLVTGDDKLTSSHAMPGTPRYMSPEQIDPAGSWGSMGPATDLYSLTAVLYQCLLGQPPFQGPSVTVLFHRILNEPPVLPRSLRPDIPQALETFVLRGLSKRKKDRFTDGKAYVEALDAAIAESPPSARAERFLRDAEAPSEDLIPAGARKSGDDIFKIFQPTGRNAPGADAGRGRVLLYAIAVLALALVAAGLMLWGRWKGG